MKTAKLFQNGQSQAVRLPKEFPDRHDNLLCAVLVLEDRVVVKTVMHHFTVL